MDIILVFLALALTIFLPGFLIIEAFFADFKFSLKLPFYIILSVLVSTWVIFIAGHLFSLNRINVLLSFVVFAPLIFLVKFKTKKFGKYIKEHKLGLIAALVSFFLVFFALWYGIFIYHQDYIVMASVNWQDTAMHMGIIESIAEGNFPPEAPYMAGKALTYYYFSDLHAAITNIIKGDFFARVLVAVNPFFILSFFLAVYALSLNILKDKKFSILAAVLTSFYSNWIFIKFFSDLNKPGLPLTLERIKNTLAPGYSIHGELYQLAPMADYFLQNRPMMVGLPVVTLVLLLIMEGFFNLNHKKLLAAGIVSALVFKFQLFAFLISLSAFGLFFVVFIRRKKLKKHITVSLYFLIPVLVSVIFVLTTNVSGNSLIELFKENFSLGSWAKENGFWWHIKFATANFGLPFIIFLLSPIFFLSNKKADRRFWGLYLFGIICFTLPFVVNFTIYKYDMFKFFYFSLIPVSVLAMGSFYLVSNKYNHLSIVLAAVIIISSTFTSSLVLAASILNKNRAYEVSEYHAGIWIRENTAENSVFLTLPSVHTPTTQIGGRLRVLSYINWPHSHGFNTGEDNVFSRLSDIENFYTNPMEQKAVLAKYNVDYIYYGLEEKNKFPQTEAVLDSFSGAMYAKNGIKIYEVNE